MSVKVMGRVWELDLPHSHMLVLLALADHADHEGANIFPSIGLVAWKCGYSERQVQRVIAELVGSGILVEVSAKPGKRVVYRIDMNKGTLKEPYGGRQNVTPDKMTPDKMSGVTSTTKGGDILSKHGVTSTTFERAESPQSNASKPDPNHHHEPSVEPSSPVAAKKEKSTPDQQVVMMLYSKGFTSAPAINGIASLGIDCETIASCIENLRADGWKDNGRIMRRLQQTPPLPNQPYPRMKQTIPPPAAPTAPADAISPQQLAALARTRRGTP